MYTLRIVSGNKVVRNMCLGKSYFTIRKADTPEVFESIRDTKGYHENVPIFAFVEDESRTYIPILSDDTNYIVTESGQTFEKL